jgi:hypothetical protein
VPGLFLQQCPLLSLQAAGEGFVFVLAFIHSGTSKYKNIQLSFVMQASNHLFLRHP